MPVQAGDDEVLARMKRGYTVGEYRDLVGRMRSRMPNVAVHTDVIVGFPGETPDQFEATVDLLAELRLDKAHIAKSRSTCAPWPPRCSTTTSHLRRRSGGGGRSTNSKPRSARRSTRGNWGNTVEVLVEGRHRDRWRGRTRTNKLVFFPDDRNLMGELVDVTVAWTGPWSMIGVASDAAPRSPREVIGLAPR